MTAAGVGCSSAQDTKHTSSMESASRHTEQKERRAKEEQAAMVVLCRKEHQEAEGWPTCVSALSRSGQARVKRPHHWLLACRPNHPAAAQLLHRPPWMCMHPDISCTLLLAARSLMSPRLPARNRLLLSSCCCALCFRRVCISRLPRPTTRDLHPNTRDTTCLTPTLRQSPSPAAKPLFASCTTTYMYTTANHQSPTRDACAIPATVR